MQVCTARYRSPNPFGRNAEGSRFTDIRGKDMDPTLVAAVECDLPGDKPADTLSYQWYETMEDADAAYDAVVAQEEDFLQVDGCGLYDGEYTLDDEDGGRYTCMALNGTTSIVYTYEPFPVVGVITKLDGESADVDAMGDFFDNEAGPTSRDSGIPSLQTQKFGSKAYKALFQRIPKSIRKSCTPNSESFTSPWIAFEIECLDPSPGVAFARYTSYRDEEGFEAAYDEDRFSSLHPFEAPEGCDSGTWSVDDEDVGSYECGVGDGRTFMTWTLDDARIVVSAYADDSAMTTDELLQWWNDDAGPLT